MTSCIACLLQSTPAIIGKRMMMAPSTTDFSSIFTKFQEDSRRHQGCLIFQFGGQRERRLSRRSRIEIKRTADERWFRYVAALLLNRRGVHPKIKQPWRRHTCFNLPGEERTVSEDETYRSYLQGKLVTIWGNMNAGSQQIFKRLLNQRNLCVMSSGEAFLSLLLPSFKRTD